MSRRIRNGLAVFGLSVIAILATDLCGRAVHSINDWISTPSETIKSDLRSQLPAYQDVDYDASTLIQEVRESSPVRYQPYTVWRRRPFQGHTTTVEVNGSRTTHYNSEDPNALNIWMFGGSTTWGVGAPDQETISSLLSKSLNERLVSTHVRNLGERGFVSTQEVVYLLRELQAGHQPNVVIFYDGVNDAAAAGLWPEVPGTHLELDVVRDRFQQHQDDMLEEFVRSTGLYKAAQVFLDRTGITVQEPHFDQEATPESKNTTEPDYHWLAKRGLDLWFENHRLVQSLASEYNFIPIFIFHPGLWDTGKPLHPSELEILESEKQSANLYMIMRVRAEMASILIQRLKTTDNTKNIYNLNEVFIDSADPLYIDYVHVTGKGNKIVSEKITDIVLSEICEISTLSATSLPKDLWAHCNHNP